MRPTTVAPLAMMEGTINQEGVVEDSIIMLGLEAVEACPLRGEDLITVSQYSLQ